jgi:molybdopterin-guanine dinucleotide biosynthesis protein A
MVGLLLLAGGQSRRMGRDKARLRGGVRRILHEAKAAGLSPRIVLAGPAPRGADLQGDGWLDEADAVIDDPAHAKCLHDVLVEILDGHLPSMILTPCDAVSVDRDMFNLLVSMGVGVPLDDEDRRQVLFSHLPEGWVAAPNAGRRTEPLFKALKGHPLGMKGVKLRTVNTPEDVAAMPSFQAGRGEGNGS